MSEAMIAVGALLVADTKTIGAISVIEMIIRRADGFFSYKESSAYELHAHLISGDDAVVACVDTEEAAFALLTTYAKQLDFVYVTPEVIARQDDVVSIFVQERERPRCTSVGTVPLKEAWHVWMCIGSVRKNICIRTLPNFESAAKSVSVYLEARKSGQIEKLRTNGKNTTAAAAATGKQ